MSKCPGVNTGTVAARVTATLTLLLALALLSATTSASTCFSVSGTFSNEQVLPPDCLSQVPICTHGKLSGDLDGDYDFKMTSLLPQPGPEHPLRFAFTGESIITLVDGEMFADDHGHLDYNPVGLSPFETNVVIHSGNGAWLGATGSLVAIGEIDFSTGAGTGTYTGEVCGAT